MPGWLRVVPSLLLAIAAGSTWFFAASRAMYRLGPHEAATAVGGLERSRLVRYAV